ncbi:MAG: tol-pal system-associated acyl-CoA thioesterase [Hydrogenophilaceae bacterium]|nr:tol-pal system-associated acyl-CoA thioesterase [Hydrogenophilaceae bacterium]
MAGAFTCPVRVYWEDTDAGGVVYYANYLKFLERARSEWLRALGFEQPDLLARHGGMFVVRRVEADYLLPARFNDSLSVEAALVEQNKASLVMAQRILRGADILMAARVTLVWVKENTFKPARIPAEILEILT